MIDSTVTYNSITISMATIEELRSEPVISEDGVQVIAMKRTLRVRGYAQNPSVSAWAEAVQVVSQSLNEPRKALTVTFDGAVLYSVNPSGSGLTGADVGNGPMPRVVACSEITGGRCCIVAWECEFTQPAVGNLAPAVLGHRWAQDFQVNAENMTTRTVVGVIHLSTAAALSDLTDPDSYRYVAFPPYVAGFVREVAEWGVTSDNRMLRYRIVDREIYRPLPAPALTGSASVRYSITGPLLTTTFQCTLKGPKPKTGATGDPDSQFSLMQAGLRLMQTRVDFARGYIPTVEITENVFASEISISATHRQSIDTARIGWFQPIGDGNTTGRQDKQITPYGSALIKAAAQAMFNQATLGNPAAGPSGLPDALDADKARVVSAGTEAVPAAPTATVLLPPTDRPSDLSFSDNPDITSATQQGANPYLALEMVSHLFVDNQFVVIQPAHSSGSDVVQQPGKPIVREIHSGTLRRLGARPILPDAAVSSLAGRRGIIERYDIEDRDPKVGADRANPVYETRFRYQIRIPYQSGSGEFSSVSASPFGTLIGYVTSTLAATPSPILNGTEDQTQSMPGGLTV